MNCLCNLIKVGKNGKKTSLDVNNLDHLRLVERILYKIGIGKKINELIGESTNEKVTAVQVFKEMLLNGLGKVLSPLY